MHNLSIDLTTIASLWLGAALLMLPIIVLTIRLAVLPLLEFWLRARGDDLAGGSATATRLTALEEEISDLRAVLNRMGGEDRTRPTAA